MQGCALELFGDRQVAFVLEWSLELVRPPFLSILQTSFVCFVQASHVFGLKREHLKLVANFHLDDADPGINLEDTGAHVYVAAYDANGKLLAEKIDKINGNNLVRWHLRPRPRAPYTVFFPWKPSQIAKVTVIEQSGTHIPPPERGSRPYALAGEFTFTCGMQMMRGKLIVESE